MQSKQVLYLCTGNYYRSRFAEILFNHLAREKSLDWNADSRGLARVFGAWNVGTISPFTLAGMQERGIESESTKRDAKHCFEDDLRAADLIVALKEAEHRPMLAEHFPGWEDRVRYWHVHDVDQAHPDDALREIEELVVALIDELSRT